MQELPTCPGQETVVGDRVKDGVGFKAGEAEPRGRLWMLTEPTPQFCGED